MSLFSREFLSLPRYRVVDTAPYYGEQDGRRVDVSCLIFSKACLQYDRSAPRLYAEGAIESFHSQINVSQLDEFCFASMRCYADALQSNFQTERNQA